MKTIVTHIGPDLDAITSIWLIKTFFPGWEEADVACVPAGSTYHGDPPDQNSDIIHVDTGYGKYDHHETDADTCAAKLVYDDIREKRGDDPSLTRLCAVVNDVDHFREAFYPDPTADYWSFWLPEIIDGWRVIYADNPRKLVSVGMDCLDGVYKMMQNRVWAQKELDDHAQVFETSWGMVCAIETLNDEVIHYAQKKGYAAVIRKDPNKGYLRIKTLPKKEIDLTPVYEDLKVADPAATWFLHASKHMILNGSTHNPDMKPTTLTLRQVMDILKKNCPIL